MLPTTIRHKILLTTVICALVILAGFSTVFLIARQQQELVHNHLELPLVTENWFSLSNKLHQILRLQLETATKQEENTAAWEKVWIKEIEPLLNILEDLYKKERLWENERQVEARTFYDIRLMLMQLKGLLEKVEKENFNRLSETPLWQNELVPLFLEIQGSIEQIIHWQTRFSHQQNQLLRSRMMELTLQIWVAAFVVLLILVLLAWFLSRQIILPLQELRDTVKKVEEDRFHGEINVDSSDEVGELAHQFREMFKAIRERTRELEESNRLLEEASHQKGMFLTSMSHELRTPLNAIIGFAGTLLDDENEPLSSYRKDRLSRILQSGKQLLQLINSLLDLSRLEAGQMKITNSKMHLDELILEVIEMLEPLIQEKSLECKHHFDTEKGWEKYQMESGEIHENPFFLVSDSAKLRQILINLLGNAIKFTEPGGSITIRLFRKRQGFQIVIEDNGCGIPEEDLGTIFQVFQQAETDHRTHREGTGLGLALVHSLVELIGARISVKSTLGEGSVFTLEIPLLS